MSDRDPYSPLIAVIEEAVQTSLKRKVLSGKEARFRRQLRSLLTTLDNSLRNAATYQSYLQLGKDRQEEEAIFKPRDEARFQAEQELLYAKNTVRHIREGGV